MDAFADPEEDVLRIESLRLGGVDWWDNTRVRGFVNVTPDSSGGDCGRSGEPKFRVHDGRGGGVDGGDGDRALVCYHIIR